jgi:putative ABC transport system ATP-binding protein
MLKVSNISKYFGSGDSFVGAVKDISFTIPTGKFAAIIGKSGSGKSTLLSLLGALDRPSNGEIMVDDKVISSGTEGELTRYRRDTIGYVFQSFNLVPNLNALENVMLPMEFAGTPKKERRTRAAALLLQVGLDTDKQFRRPAKLSGGEQQRVAIARALANRPKLILADEPTGNLDSSTGRTIFELLYGLAKSENTTIIAVTHDLSISEKSDLSFTLADGKLIASTHSSKK